MSWKYVAAIVLSVSAVILTAGPADADLISQPIRPHKGFSIKLDTRPPAPAQQPQDQKERGSSPGMAEKTLFPRRWYGGMISANLEVIWEMSVWIRRAPRRPWTTSSWPGSGRRCDGGFTGPEDHRVGTGGAPGELFPTHR